MPLTKDPCSSCKAKHVKCITDDDRSECRRCVTKAIQCCRPARKAFFRPGSSARYDTQFSDQQNWVSSNAREYRIQKPSGRPSRHIVQDEVILPPDILTEVGITESHPDSVEHAVSNDRLKSHDTFPGAPHCDTSVEIPPILDTNSVTPLMRQTAVQIGSRQDLTETESTPIPELPIIRRCQPFKDIQEACLLRYYVEELSHWFDTCDEQKHFQQLVPIWARRFPPLLQAIFATSARHLSRLPKYRTSQGVLYCGQLLPNVTSSSAVEYMLTCIPALREFHDTQDEEHREYIMATAVILRQFEEMEDDEDDINLSESLEGPDTPAYPQNRGNFLAIINTVVRSSYSEDLFRRQGLFSAAYWIALRQEVYYAFTRGQSPQMILLPSTLWQDATIVNKMIMHTAQVAKWFRTDKSEQEWLRLKEQELLLDQQLPDEYTPTFKQKADKSKGEVFPTIWYGSDLVVTGVQHMEIAKMVLIAESPFLEVHSNTRAANRKIETEVRQMVLDLCGITLQHPRIAPHLVNASIGILLYGDFFTDQWERKALASVVERFKNVCAWPLPKALQSFHSFQSS